MSAVAQMTCSACPTAATGGRCPRCGLYWFRNEAGKMCCYRLDLDAPHAAAQPPEFWRTAPNLREAVDLARQLEPRFAEAVDALAGLWQAVLGMMTGQQMATLLICHTRNGTTSGEVATALKVSQQQASNVLQALVAKRLVRRTREGRTVRYRVAFLWPTGVVSTASQIVAKGMLAGVAGRVDTPSAASRVSEQGTA